MAPKATGGTPQNRGNTSNHRAAPGRGRGGNQGSNLCGHGEEPARGRGRGLNVSDHVDEPTRGKGRGRGGLNEHTRGVGRQKHKGGSGQCRNNPPPPTPYPETTDPVRITRPVLNLVDPALKGAWKINTTHRMSLIFDSVIPIRQFQQDVLYNNSARPEDAFAKYNPNPEDDPNVTEDEGDDDLKLYDLIFVL